MALAARDLRSYGARDGVNSEVIGFNYRMDELQSAVLRVKLAHLDSYVQARRRIAKAYTDAFSSLGIETPAPEGVAQHAFYAYAIRTARREELRAFLARKGIGTGIHYATPLHFMQSFREDGHAHGRFPHAERCAKEFLSLPIHPSMDVRAVETVIEAVRQWVL